MALNVFFWTIALFTGAWGVRSTWLGDWQNRMSPISKVFSVFFPALIVGMMQIESLQRQPGVFIVLTYLSSEYNNPLYLEPLVMVLIVL